jgi:hypothetical protein
MFDIEFDMIEKRLKRCSFRQISEAIKCVLLVGRSTCTKAKADADKALATAKQKYPANTLHNGIGDAFRHCYWNALMTISVGRNDAKKIADLHEDHNGGSSAERKMDLKNNDIGRQVGIESKTAAEAETKCAQHVTTGHLQLRP